MTSNGTEQVALRIEHLNVNRPRHPGYLLEDVTFSLRSGEWLSVIGPNGAGKSTLLRALASGRSSRGSITVSADTDHQTKQPSRAQQIAYVPQEIHVGLPISVRDFVLLGRAPHIGRWRRPSQKDMRVVDQTLERLDIAALAGHDVTTLSGGEKRRAAIAQALAQQTNILLLDEPTDALDIAHQQHVLALLDELRQQNAVAIMSVLHDLSSAVQWSDRIALLHRGRLVACDQPLSVVTAKVIAPVYGIPVNVLQTDFGAVVQVGSTTQRAHS